MRNLYSVFVMLTCLIFIAGCAAIPYIGPHLTRLGATQLITAGGLTLTVGDIAVYFIADQGLEAIIEDLAAFCPDEFQNKSYCILIGTDGDKLTGNFYVQGSINQDIALSIETTNNPITCQLPKGVSLKEKLNCDVNNIQKLEDIDIRVIENNKPFFISISSLKKGLEVVKDSEVIKNLKKGRKIFKFFK